MKTDLALRKRMIVNVIMVPALAVFSMLGGWWFTLMVTIVLSVAAWELCRMFRKGGYLPSPVVMVFFTAAAALMRYLLGFDYAGLWLSILILVGMFVHTLQQQKQGNSSAIDFFITIGGAIYIGWLGSYAISIRAIENGLHWVFLVFPIISIADSGGYIFGRLFGKHKMLPLVSPKKSWEGYIGGIIMGTLGGWGFAALWHIPAPGILPWHGIVLGALISILAPFGDFGESMLKRQFKIKDSSNILLEHGGILDRADSSLWAAPIGFYLILLLFM
jgi:phosphatidate cytidylyltransferase